MVNPLANISNLPAVLVQHEVQLVNHLSALSGESVREVWISALRLTVCHNLLRRIFTSKHIVNTHRPGRKKIITAPLRKQINVRSKGSIKDKILG